MAYTPKLPKINGYSLTDFHDFKECSFRFFVRHHLDKKYEIAVGSPQMALGVLLDESIKNIHKTRAYGYPLERTLGVVKYSKRKIIDGEAENPRQPNFNTAVVKFLTDDVVNLAENLLINYYIKIDGQFKKAIFIVEFCKWFLEVDGEDYVLWGSPDTVEEGKNSIPDVIDYKSRQDISKGKERMDMDLMPKIYTLLVSKILLNKGYKKARFLVKFWQDPLEDDFSEEFDLQNLGYVEEIFREKIREILKTKKAQMCGGKYCDACNSDKRLDFIKELEKMGIGV